MPALCECLRKAAYDPRIAGLFVRIDPLAIGWAKAQVCTRLYALASHAACLLVGVPSSDWHTILIVLSTR